ncbi:MAG: 4Fe-4S dicluster domain-containing protein [Candidatus Acididesulfobacter guangdongensis]|uniref:4Fe-4S dicluster domain-containing protein n=1 Tax=Acididesulfobacter guangdongensis TaxID=2597225 RepID=A0A519BHT9_ACIG2|nr:MAG: 4Fe-4S dicluster domain-containing protein [Candidatus Acididesulfobacter guangdongensis]
MNLLRIIDKIISGSENGNKILINEYYCTRLRSPMSSCYVCINKCPEQAIEINDSAIKISDKCSLCKLCINICPNYVFDLKEGTDISDKVLMYQNSAYYFCSMVNSNLKSNIGRIVSCINEVDDADIIKHLNDADDINFVTAGCEDCRYNFFYKRKMKAINRILNGLTDAEGNNINIAEKIKFIDHNKFDFSCIINNNEKESKKIKSIAVSMTGSDNDNYNDNYDDNNNDNINDNAAAVSNMLANTRMESGNINNSTDEYSQRRLFFREMSKTIKENAVKLAKNFPLEELPFNEFFLSNEDKNLNKLFFKKRFKLFNFIKCNPDCLDLLDIRLPSINRNCLLCANCWEFCPTGALTYNNNDEAGAVILDPYLCTGCRLCKDLCSFGAVKMVKPAGLKDISSKKVLFKKLTFD